MRGRVNPQSDVFYAIDLEQLVPADHPLRAIKQRADGELRRLRPHFDEAYSGVGRPSVPPEQLIKASLLQALYSIRSERELCQQIAYNLLFRWFLGLAPDAAVWDHSTFTQNRKRFAEHGLMRRFFEGSVARAIEAEAASNDHFSVDGTLIQAWGSMKNFRPKDENKDGDDGPGDANRWSDFRGEKRSNQTHESKTDPEARLMRKGAGREAILAHSLHVLMENRNGLLLDIEVAEANGTAERKAALSMLARVRKRHWLRPKTLAADKGYDDGEFLLALEKKHKAEPHVAIREGEIKSENEEAEARRRARKRAKTKTYAMSQCCRRRIEQPFSWIKKVAGMAKARFVGRWKIQEQAWATGACYNLMRLTKLAAA